MDSKLTPQQHLDLWQASGLSQREYCRQNSVNANTFAYWMRRSREAKQEKDQEWVRIQPEEEKGVTARHLNVRINLGFMRLEYTRTGP